MIPDGRTWTRQVSFPLGKVYAFMQRKWRRIFSVLDSPATEHIVLYGQVVALMRPWLSMLSRGAGRMSHAGVSLARIHSPFRPGNGAPSPQPALHDRNPQDVSDTPGTVSSARPGKAHAT